MLLYLVPSTGGFLCGWWSVVAEHDVERSGEVVGEGAAAAFVHEGQQEGQQEQSQEKEPQRKSQPTHPLQQPRLLLDLCCDRWLLLFGWDSLDTESGPDVSHILQLGFIEHPAVAKFLQTHIFCWSRSSLTALTLLEQKLELLLTPGHSSPQTHECVLSRLEFFSAECCTLGPEDP